MDVAGGPNCISRVQILAQSALSTVPPEYIQQPTNRPQNPSPQTPSPSPPPTFPVIDLSSAAVLPLIASACSSWGAFHATNHSVPTHLLASLRSAALSFFSDLPVSDKLRYACDPVAGPAAEGYGSRMLSDGAGGALDWRDYFDHHTLPLARRNPSRWPHFPPEYRGLMADHAEKMEGLAKRLLGLVSESLGLGSRYIEEAVAGDGGGGFYQNVTVSYYPPCPQPELTLGLQAHSDMGAITLLIQDDVGGLQVWKDGDWITVEPVEDAIVVLLGDQTEIISNGTYKSCQHRAITNANRARLSIATFHDPAKTVKICPAPELVKRHCGAWYRDVVYGDYVSSWYTKGPEGKRNLDALLL